MRPTAPPLRWRQRPSAVKEIFWQLDPYASNRDYTAPGGFAREGQLLDALDGTFVTSQALPDYADGAPLAPWRKKVHVLGFPTLLPRVMEPVEHDDIQCVFCGSLHPGMREPGFALALFRALHDDTVTLTMAGGGWGALKPTPTRQPVLWVQNLYAPACCRPTRPPRWKTAPTCLSAGQHLRQSDAEQAVRLFCHRQAGLAPGRERE